MKKLLFVSLFIICAFAASAQWSIAPELGLSAFSHNNGGSDGWRPAVKAGAAVEYAFRPHFCLIVKKVDSKRVKKDEQEEL